MSSMLMKIDCVKHVQKIAQIVSAPNHTSVFHVLKKKFYITTHALSHVHNTITLIKIWSAMSATKHANHALDHIQTNAQSATAEVSWRSTAPRAR